MMDTWHVELEPIVEGVRVFSVGDTYLDPYPWCATAKYRSPTDVELTLVDKPIKLEQWKAVLRKFAETGVKTVRFKRIKHGVEREHVFDLT